MERRVGALPGVQQVSAGFAVPWRDARALDINFMFAVDGAKRKNGEDDVRARFFVILPMVCQITGSTSRATPRKTSVVTSVLLKNIASDARAINPRRARISRSAVD